MSNPNSPKAVLTKPQWWMLFIVSTVYMSLFFRQFKAFTLVPDWETALWLLGVIAMLVALMSVLLYDSYVHEKRQGKIVNRMPVFEWLDARHFMQGNSR